MTFTYTPLPDVRRNIRLFSIVPGKDGTVIKIALGNHYRLSYGECPLCGIVVHMGPTEPSAYHLAEQQGNPRTREFVVAPWSASPLWRLRLVVVGCFVH